MSMFKRFTKKSSDKSPSKLVENTENRHPEGLRKATATTTSITTTSQTQHSPNNNSQTKDDNRHEDAPPDAPLQLPISRRKERNMSISKSGRHKLKSKQRGSVLGSDLYHAGASSPETSPTGPNAAPRTIGPWDAPLSLSNSQPTTV